MRAIQSIDGIAKKSRKLKIPRRRRRDFFTDTSLSVRTLRAVEETRLEIRHTGWGVLSCVVYGSNSSYLYSILNVVYQVHPYPAWKLV